MNIYVVRHGETDWNLLYRLQGQSDVPLNEKGRAEARATAAQLREIPFAAVYVSPLGRARETAEILTEGRRIPWHVDERLIEMGFGVYEGKSSVNPDYLVEDEEFGYRFKQRPSLYAAPEGGETFESVCARTTEFLMELAAKEEYQEENVLVVSHGAAICGLLSSLRMNGDMDRFWGDGPMKNCSVTILAVKGGTIAVAQENKIFY